MSPSALPAAGRPLSILVVTPDVPPPDRDAGSLRLLRLLELLAGDGHRLTLVGRAGVDQAPATRALEALGVEVHPVDPERCGFPLAAPALDLRGVIARVRPDVAWLSFYDTAEVYLPLLRAWSPATRVVIDTVDVHSVREARAAALSGSAEDAARAERTREREAAIYGAADALIAVSDDDARALGELAPEVPSAVIGTVHADAPAGPPRAARDGALFVGNFRHTPNVDAALWLARDVWPLVRARRPDARLTLVGTAPPAEVLALDDAARGIAVAGWVPEVAPYLDAAVASVAPLRFGAGVKGKIGEALAHGLPVVTTPIGNEGMDLVDGEHALVAQDAAGLAAALVALHEDDALWDRLSAGGRAALASRLGPERALRGLRELLVSLAPTAFLATADLRASLAAYLRAFAPSDPVTLAIPLAPGVDPNALYTELVDHITALGHDPEAIPDVAVHAWPAEATIPATAITTDPATWSAAALIPSARPAARAAVVVRLPADASDVAAIDVPYGAELIVCAADGQDVDTTARIVRHAPDAGRRAVLARALHATSAEVVVAVEPHVVPEPGCCAALIKAIDNGATLAGPVLDGAHGLQLGHDGTLWPILDPATASADALPLDVLAATRTTWSTMPAALPSREGHAETQLAAHLPAAPTVVTTAHARRAPAPAATVIVCTRDRFDILEDTVTLVVGQGAAEVLIVDNGSTDATPDVAARLAARHPDVVRVVDEPAAGLSRARNAGARAARHDLLIYLDDDARPAPGWLPAFARELARDGVVSAGGPIVGLWPAERAAAWPEPGLEPLYGILDHGDGDRTLVPPDIVYGGNWGVRRAALDAVGGFDVALGVAPGVRIGGEEASVAWRLERAGLGATRYVAAASVGHLIGAHRLTDRFLVERALTVGLERPRHVADADRDTLLANANAAAERLHRAAPMQGTARLEDAVSVIVAADAPQRTKTFAADALGELTACVLLLGEREVSLGDLTLTLRPEHLDGLLEPVAAA